MPQLLHLLEIVFIVFCWSINPHIKKHIMIKSNQINYYFINSFVISTLIQVMYLKFYFDGTFSPATLTIPSRKQCLFILLSASISVFSSFFVARLIDSTNISKLVPKLQPSVIVLTAVISYCMGETIRTQQWIGIVFIVFGIALTL